MAVDAGSATGYLDLDINGFVQGLAEALKQSQQTEKQIESVGNKITGIGDKMSKVGGTLTKTVTTPIVGIGTAAVAALSGFESSMSRVQAISGATGDELAQLREKAKEMGATTKFSASESADALTYMAMAGWDTKAMLDGIDGIMALAAADGLDLATTSDIVTDALTAFGLSASDSSHFADVLAKASSSANTNVSILGESFKYVAPVAGALGYTAEDTAIALGLMANAGIKGSQGGTALRSSLAKLAAPSKEAASAMEQYGISITNADGTMKSLGGVMDMLRDNLGGLSKAQQTAVASTLFGQEAMSGMLAIINASEKDYNDLTNEIYNCNGAAQAMADIQMDNFEGQITTLKSSLEGVGIQIGEILLPHIQNFVGKIQELVNWFANLDPKQQEQIVKWAGIAAAVGPVILVMGKLMSGAGKVVSGIEKVSGVLGGLGKSTKGVPGPLNETSGAVGSLSKNALGLVAAGAGILLAAAGLALLARAAIQLADAGWPAIAVMGGLVVALAGLAAGATLVAAPLTAGAVGLIAFGAAVALVGIGIGVATAGVALLATQLPTIATYGAQAGSALAALGAGLLEFGGGVALAGAGCIVLGAGLLTVGAGALVAAAGVTALGVAVVILGAGVVVCGAGLTLCGAGMAILAATASTAAAGMAAFGAASLAGVAGTAAMAAGILALDAAVVTGLVTLGLLTVELGLSAAACSLLAAAMVATAASVSSIESSAANAANSLQQMVTSVDVVKSGLGGLEAVVSSAMDNFTNAIRKTQNSAKTEALALATAIVTSINTGLAPLPNQMAQQGTRSVDAFGSAMSSSIGGLSSEAYVWGQDVIQGLINGIDSKLPALRSKVNEAASTISSRLHFSVPDEGPLTTYEQWMPDFIQGLADGIDNNIYRLDAPVSNLADALVPDIRANAIVSGEVQAISNMREYNDTIVVTIGLYGQLLMQMREFNAIAGGITAWNNEDLFAMSRVSAGRAERRSDIDYVAAKQRSDNERAGDTFIFNSPKPIDEAEAARQMKRAKRDLTEGF